MDVIRPLWRRRRWAFGAYLLFALARIPARTNFRLGAPACDVRLTLENASRSLTKLPHIVLFGVFFLLAALQFERFDRRTAALSLLLTSALGLIVEVEEGATRTGNCRLTDLLPDLVGALGAAVVVGATVAVWARVTRQPGIPPNRSRVQ